MGKLLFWAPFEGQANLGLENCGHEEWAATDPSQPLGRGWWLGAGGHLAVQAGETASGPLWVLAPAPSESGSDHMMQAENRGWSGTLWTLVELEDQALCNPYVGVLGARSLEQRASSRTSWSRDLHISSPSGLRFACLFAYVCIKPAPSHIHFRQFD